MANFVKINGNEIYRPPEWSPEREDIYAAEITTCTGKTIADRIGWKYSDATLEWDALPQAMVDVLVDMSGECSFEFTDADGDHEEAVIRSSMVSIEHPYAVNGVTWWKDVKVEVKFIDSHN